jgi:hypothetical protein
MEKRICELKHDLGADDFCLQDFYATEAANQLNLNRIFGVGSGGRTHDIQSHSLAFCH